MKRSASLLAAIACAFSAQVSAALIDFEDVIYAAEWRSLYEIWGLGSEIYANGYTLRYRAAPHEPYPTGFQAVGPLWRYNFRDSVAVNPNSCSARVMLTAQDNNPFDLVSVDVQELNGAGALPATITFEGTTSGQHQVSHTVTLDGTAAWETVTFPDTFNRLQEVEWKQGDCYTNMPHMFDNIQIVPSHLRANAPRRPRAK
jgi:hypothetical protein